MDKYRLVGASYDLLGKLYSGNQIYHCKVAMLNDTVIQPDAKVLFAGAGHGVDAVRAAELGADVTVVDISPTMTAKFENNLKHHPDSQSLNIRVLQQDILEHRDQYDIVVCNFFLNVFDRKFMLTLLSHLCGLCKEQGQVIIGDFCPAEGSLITNAIQNVYWYAAATAFHVLAGNAIHKIYSYQPILEALNFEIQEKAHFRLLGCNMYYSLRAQRTV